MDNAILNIIYHNMIKSRVLDSRLLDMYKNKQLYGTTHLSIGQEAAGCAAVEARNAGDAIFSNHRNHAHTIACGMSYKQIMCELFGKESGCCGGKGGSMHLMDPSKSYYGANGVVAGSMPLAAGAALAFLRKNTKQVAFSFFGDGATNQGVFHECLNMAAIWNLPVVFVCENNKYGLSRPIEHVTKVTLSERGKAYGLPCVLVDGNDPIKVYNAVKSARDLAALGTPSMVVCDTYRLCGHSKSDLGTSYRSISEVENARLFDPMLKVKSALGEKYDEIYKNTQDELEDAVQFALAQNPPPADAIYANIYQDVRGDLF